MMFVFCEKFFFNLIKKNDHKHAKINNVNSIINLAVPRGIEPLFHG